MEISFKKKKITYFRFKFNIKFFLNFCLQKFRKNIYIFFFKNFYLFFLKLEVLFNFFIYLKLKYFFKKKIFKFLYSIETYIYLCILSFKFNNLLLFCNYLNFIFKKQKLTKQFFFIKFLYILFKSCFLIYKVYYSLISFFFLCIGKFNVSGCNRRKIYKKIFGPLNIKKKINKFISANTILVSHTGCSNFFVCFLKK